MTGPRKEKKVRLDSLLCEQGFFPDAEQAKRAILAHEVKVGDRFATSAAELVAPGVQLSVKAQRRFVSRGGEKLAHALETFHIDVRGLRAIDIGSSTGGFTDCLLQAGAASVTAVDVNYGQLAWQLRQDERVHIFERTNIRTADPVQLGAPFDLIVADVSFIGLASLAPVFAKFAQRGTRFVGLVKPQFESKRGETDHGVVRSAEIRERVVEEVQQALVDVGFHVEGVVESPLRGPAGNVEFLIDSVYS